MKNFSSKSLNTKRNCQILQTYCSAHLKDGIKIETVEADSKPSDSKNTPKLDSVKRSTRWDSIKNSSINTHFLTPINDLHALWETTPNTDIVQSRSRSKVEVNSNEISKQLEFDIFKGDDKTCEDQTSSISTKNVLDNANQWD